MAGHRRETLALRKQEHNPKCMDFLQHSKYHWTWNDCFLAFMHYAICPWEFIFESVVRSQQWIYTCFGCWPASNNQNRKLLQRWIHSGSPLHVFLCNLGDPKIVQGNAYKSTQNIWSPEIIFVKERSSGQGVGWLIVLFSYSSLQITIVGVSCAWLVVARRFLEDTFEWLMIHLKTDIWLSIK